MSNRIRQESTSRLRECGSKRMSNRGSSHYRERYYAGIKDDPKLHVKLTGSWETTVGEQDTFFHILEYENYGGYDKTTQLIRSSEVRFEL